MALRDQRQDVRGLLRRVLLEPFLEQRLQFERQAQQRVAGDRGSGLARAFEDRLHLAVVEGRDHRRRQHPGRDAGLGQRGDRFEPALRRRGARLHLARQLAIERRDRDRDDGKIVARHLGENVEIALDQRPFGDDRDRMAEIAQHFEDRAGDPEPPLGRLVRVGIAAERDRAAGVSLLAQFRRKQRRRARLVEDAGLEIETGRQAEIGMARPRIAIDAAVLAAAIRVDRAVEADIRRVVAGDDRARRVDAEPGFEPRRLVVLDMSQPSSKATRFSRSKRPVSLLAAPRPLRALTVAGISMRRSCRADENIARTDLALGNDPDAQCRRSTAGCLGRACDRAVGGDHRVGRRIDRRHGAYRRERPERLSSARRAAAAASSRPEPPPRPAIGCCFCTPIAASEPAGRRRFAPLSPHRTRPVGPAISPSRWTTRAPAARRLERIVRWRCRAAGAALRRPGIADLPPLYDAVGGFAAIPLMEDVDLVRRLGRRRARAASRCRSTARPGAIARTDISGDRCAICSACRCISPACRRAISRGFTAEAA